MMTTVTDCHTQDELATKEEIETLIRRNSVEDHVEQLAELAYKG